MFKKFGVLDKKTKKTTSKGTGFNQPSSAHKHWHVDISYINLSGTFYYLCSVLDGYSRYILSWDIRESMKEADVEQIIQAARDRYPDAKPRIISDNGPQFIAKDFKEFIRLTGMTHVRTSPFYPQSNGKIERWHRELKSTCIRPKAATTKDEMVKNVSEFIDHYNDIRLHSALGYVSPKSKLCGKEEEIFKTRDSRLERAREARKKMRRQEREFKLGKAN